MTKNRCNGVNIVSLWLAAEAKGYSTPIWATYRQRRTRIGAQQCGGEGEAGGLNSKSKAQWRVDGLPGRVMGHCRAHQVAVAKKVTTTRLVWQEARIPDRNSERGLEGVEAPALRGIPARSDRR